MTAHSPEISHINAIDAHGDTPLHYAAAARKVHNIRTLISRGASTSAKNSLGLRPHELMAWSAIYLGSRYIKFADAGRTPWEVGRDFASFDTDREYGHEKHFYRIRSEVRAALRLFRKHGCRLHPGLERLVLAWDDADMPKGHRTYYRKGGFKLRMQLVSIEATSIRVVDVNGVQTGGLGG